MYVCAIVWVICTVGKWLLLHVILCEACVELSCLIDIKPANLLFHDRVEELLSKSLHLTSCGKSPKGHLHISREQDYKSHNAVVYSMPEKEIQDYQTPRKTFKLITLKYEIWRKMAAPIQSTVILHCHLLPQSLIIGLLDG